MRNLTILALGLAIVAMLAAGCGGGGGTAAPPGGNDQPEPAPDTDTATIEGKAVIDGDTQDYQILLDGQPVPNTLDAEGNYIIEGVPPGRHRVAVVRGDGMTGGYATVEAPRNGSGRAPDIETRPGGQIVGIVSVIEEGALRPLEGVEITARPAPAIADQGGEGEAAPQQDDLETYSAFSGAYGDYFIRAIPRGEYVVTVHAPEMADAWKWVRVTPGHTAVADFQLRPTPQPGVGSVEGHVFRETSGGDTVPIQGARVTVRTENAWEPVGPIETPPPPPMDPEDGAEGDGDEPIESPPPDPGDIAPPWIDVVSTITRADGSYSLNTPAGSATIEVYMPGYEPAREQIDIPAEETVVMDFALTQWDDVPPPPPGDEPGAPGDQTPPFGGATPPPPPF